MVAIPILTSSIPDLDIAVNSEDTKLNLFNYFDDPFTSGLVARFDLFNPNNTFPNEGVSEVLLFDQADEGAPLTVENFQNYVEDGDYVNSIVNRLVPDFVVQGGGFSIEEFPNIESVPTDDPVQNEFSADRSNVENTIAMAKLGGDPDSATSQWFFNLADNSENLDNQNGGFTVFGELLSETDTETVDAIAQLPTFNLSQQLGSAFSSIPFDVEDANNPSIESVEDFVRYESITISQQPELTFTVANNSNPELVEATIEGEELSLDYLENQTGEAEIAIQATNLVGETVEETFSVTVEEALPPTPESELVFGSPVDDNLEATETETQNITFAGTGEDTVNNSNSQQSSYRLYGGAENDNLIVGGRDRAFGGDGNDNIDASLGQGNNRLYGGAGDDNLTVGNNDRAFGGDGNDTLSFTTGGGNILFGGAGEDNFVINPPDAPNSLNTIHDFGDGEDQITFTGFPDADFNSLRITPATDGEATLIGLENALVRLDGIIPDTLTEADFNFTT